MGVVAGDGGASDGTSTGRGLPTGGGVPTGIGVGCGRGVGKGVAYAAGVGVEVITAPPTPTVPGVTAPVPVAGAVPGFVVVVPA